MNMKYTWSGLVLTPQKCREGTYARKAKASARPIPPASCRLGRACAVFHFLLVAVDRVTAARTHVLLQCFVSDHTLATPSYRPYRLASMPVTLHVILPALQHYLPSLLNTSWDKGAELLRRTINVLFGKLNSKYDSMFCLSVTISR